MTKKVEKRVFDDLKIEKRESGEFRISGYAAKFEKLSEDLGGFREKIKPGAFKKALAKSDVRALLNHDPNKIIGRTGVNLELKEDKTGLHMEISPVDTPTYKEVEASIRAGLITQQSFGFYVGADSWASDKKQGEIRTIEEVDELFDVSPVTYPAYPDTTVALEARSKYIESLEPEKREKEEAKPSESEGQMTSRTEEPTPESADQMIAAEKEDFLMNLKIKNDQLGGYK